MRRLRHQVLRFAATDATVLIRGETGTGKELVARALHDQSRRARRSFVAANVAALPATTLLAELFGHERGAFTGASCRRRGLFEQAHGGTLLLDEVGELAPEAQAALLRVLETREVRPLGAERVHSVDVRLVAATHRDLLQMVRLGSFREDLFYRLNLLVVEVPPLRHRPGDVAVLSKHFLSEHASEFGLRTLSPCALAALSDHPWPGNVRQLQNVLRRMVVSDEAATLDASHVDAALRFERSDPTVAREGLTPERVMRALAAESGNISRTARRLGVCRTTVRAHLNRAREAELL